jgi:hypothetical protein
MSIQIPPADRPDQAQRGYDISQTTFDQDGVVDGLDLDELDGIAGGLAGGGDGQNRLCGPTE